MRVPGRFPRSNFASADTLIRTQALFPQLLAFDQAAIAVHLAADRENSRGRDTALLELVNQTNISHDVARTYAINPEPMARTLR